MQRMRIAGISSCSRFGQVVLEDPDGMVRLQIRLRPIVAHWLAHELKECQCPALSMYRLIQELRLAAIDASEDHVPLGLMILCRQNGEEIRQSCHPADAIAMAVRMQVPLYATSRALQRGSWKNIQPWFDTLKPQDFQ